MKCVFLIRAIYCAVGCTVLATLPVSAVETVQTDITYTQPSETTITPWKAWNLTETDWLRYQQLMKGSRGVWSPNASPINVLGAHTTDTTELDRLAEIAARLSIEREVGERRWQLHVNQARQKLQTTELAAHENLTVPASLLAGNSAPPPLNSNLTASDTLLVVAPLNCDTVCQQTVALLVVTPAKIHFFIEGATTDIQIRQWATDRALPLQDAIRGRIILNYANNIRQQLSFSQTPVAVVKQTSEGYQHVSIQ